MTNNAEARAREAAIRAMGWTDPRMIEAAQRVAGGRHFQSYGGGGDCFLTAHQATSFLNCLRGAREMASYGNERAAQEREARLSTDAEVLRGALEQAQAQLKKAADQFAFYADAHAGKGTADGDAKAATNMSWARSLAQTDHACRAALSPTIDSADGGGEA